MHNIYFKFSDSPGTPPIGLATQKPQQPESQQTSTPKAPQSITPVTIFHMPAANPKTFVGPRRPIILEGRLNTQGKAHILRMLCFQQISYTNKKIHV